MQKILEMLVAIAVLFSLMGSASALQTYDLTKVNDAYPPGVKVSVTVDDVNDQLVFELVYPDTASLKTICFNLLASGVQGIYYDVNNNPVTVDWSITGPRTGDGFGKFLESVESPQEGPNYKIVIVDLKYDLVDDSLPTNGDPYYAIAAVHVKELPQTTVSGSDSLWVSDGEIPEFPTVALPIAAILGLAFVFMHRREER